MKRTRLQALFSLVRGALAAALACGLAASADAQQKLSIDALDRDGDGRLERDEFPLERLPEFSDIDRNADATVDSFELYDYQQAQRRRGSRRVTRPVRQGGGAPAGESRAKTQRASSAEEWVRRADRNRDGKLGFDEVGLANHDTVMRMDADGDGFVSLQEARALDEARAEASTTQGSGGSRTMTRTLRLMDTNGDGRLQLKEAPLAVQRRFDTLDRNGDGAIDAGEASAADGAGR